MNKQERKLVQFKDGDLVHVYHAWTFNKRVMYDCIIVASRDGREGGELTLTENELKSNLA